MNMTSMIFYVCPLCGNVLGTIYSSGVIPSCCGKPMQTLEPGVTDGDLEKHIPFVTKEADNTLRVRVGSIAHPMTKEHYIEWILLHTSRGNYRKVLNPGEAPETVFRLTEDERPLEVLAYCNIHRLWKMTLPPVG